MRVRNFQLFHRVGVSIEKVYVMRCVLIERFDKRTADKSAADKANIHFFLLHNAVFECRKHFNFFHNVVELYGRERLVAIA